MAMSDGTIVPLSPEQRALVASAQDEVDFQAKRMWPKLKRHLSLDELRELGNMGLLDAVQTYDRSLDGKFTRFARHRIRGEMLDAYLLEARGEDHARALCIQAGYGVLSRQRPAGGVMLDMDGKAEERLLEHGDAVAASLFAMAAGITSRAANPEAALGACEARQRGLEALRRGLAKLRPREREVLSKHYLEGDSLSKVGEALGIPHPGVYRVHDRGIAQLGVLMRAEGIREEPPPEREP